jgi:hypothetical protein
MPGRIVLVRPTGETASAGAGPACKGPGAFVLARFVLARAPDVDTDARAADDAAGVRTLAERGRVA